MYRGSSNLIYYDGTNLDQTLAAFKARVAPRDNNSKTEFTPFLSLTGSSPTFLHIDPAIPTQAEAGGIPIAGITSDYDGDTRNVTSPDIGADEGVFTIADLSPPTIAYTPLSITCSLGNRALNGVNITDATGTSTGARRPRVYYKKGVLGTWVSQPGTLASGTALNGNWDFTIVAADMGGLTIVDTVYYYVIAEDVISPANVGAVPGLGLVAGSTISVSTHPTNPYFYTFANDLNGTYSVGASGTYTTLTAAVNAYNNSCLTGPVVFELLDGSYSGSESFPIEINQNAFASSTNTLTIRPASSVIATISGNVGTNGIIKLNGADYIIIDGSNSGGTDRSLTIMNTNTATNSAGIWVSSLGDNNGSHSNTIKNCNIMAGEIGSATTIQTFGIHIGVPRFQIPVPERIMTILLSKIMRFQRRDMVYMPELLPY
jgi:trimeric autotransporter adhesin